MGGSIQLKYVSGDSNALAPDVQFRVTIGRGEQTQTSHSRITHNFDACVARVLPEGKDSWDFSSAVDTDLGSCEVSVVVLKPGERNFAVFKRSKTGALEEWKKLQDYDEELDSAIADEYRSGKDSWHFNYKSPGSTKRHYTVDFTTTDITWKRRHHNEQGKLVLLKPELQHERRRAIERAQQSQLHLRQRSTDNEQDATCARQVRSSSSSTRGSQSSSDDAVLPFKLEPAYVQPSLALLHAGCRPPPGLEPPPGLLEALIES